VRITNVAVLGMGILMLLGSLDVAAAERGPLNDRFYVALGGYAFSADTELRLDGEGGRGTTVDWERDLGLDDKDSFRLDAFWRFADRHKLRAIYFENRRSNSRTLTDDITIKGEVYPVNAVVEASAETRIIELAYEYAFLKRDNYELAATAGVHLTRLVPAIEITGSVGGTDVEVGQEGEAKVNMPLPVLGLRGMWNLGGDFYLDGYAQYFYLSFDGSEGSLSDLRLAVTWNPKPWFGLGVGYNQFDSDLDVDRDNFDGELDWTYRGPQVFFVTSF
jgi:hypothetical protein